MNFIKLKETMVRFFLIVVVSLCVDSANANNGLYLIGFGTESTLMGGADVAVAHDPTAINTNPAGLNQIRGKDLTTGLLFIHSPDNRHRDILGNDVSASNRSIVGVGFG